MRCICTSTSDFSFCFQWFGLSGWMMKWKSRQLQLSEKKLSNCLRELWLTTYVCNLFCSLASLVCGTRTRIACLEKVISKASCLSFLAVSVWLEYVQFAIGGMAEEDGIQKTRDVFERAVTAAGLHVTKGTMLWEAYREFENAILGGLQVCRMLET